MHAEAAPTRSRRAAASRIGRAVHTEHAAGRSDRCALRLSKQLHAVAEQLRLLFYFAVKEAA
jgi:hypothetical protein